MDSGMVFVKTDKGAEEIDKRTYRLNFKHRTALIMVDGVSAVVALLPKIPGEGMALLEDLLRDGFIAAAGGSVPERPAEPAPASASADTASFDLDEAKFRAVKAIEAVLGPGGESWALAIERSKTRAEFAQHALRARDIIAQVGGQRKATDFWDKTGL